MIQDEGVRVEVGDNGEQGTCHRFVRGQRHPLSAASAETVTLVVFVS